MEVQEEEEYDGVQGRVYHPRAAHAVAPALHHVQSQRRHVTRHVAAQQTHSARHHERQSELAGGESHRRPHSVPVHRRVGERRSQDRRDLIVIIKYFNKIVDLA